MCIVIQDFFISIYKPVDPCLMLQYCNISTVLSNFCLISVLFRFNFYPHSFIVFKHFLNVFQSPGYLGAWRLMNLNNELMFTIFLNLIVNLSRVWHCFNKCHIISICNIVLGSRLNLIIDPTSPCNILILSFSKIMLHCSERLLTKAN